MRLSPLCLLRWPTRGNSLHRKNQPVFSESCRLYNYRQITESQRALIRLICHSDALGTMGSYITRYCSCGAVLESFYGGSAKMTGTPFLECDRCGKIFDRQHIAAEWDLMTPRFQVEVKINSFVRKLFIGGAWVLFGVYGTAMYLLKPPDLLAMNHVLLLFVWIAVAVPLAACFYKRDIDGQIRRSRERMADPSYHSKLVAIGYLKDKAI